MSDTYTAPATLALLAARSAALEVKQGGSEIVQLLIRLYRILLPSERRPTCHCPRTNLTTRSKLLCSTRRHRHCIKRSSVKSFCPRVRKATRNTAPTRIPAFSLAYSRRPMRKCPGSPADRLRSSCAESDPKSSRRGRSRASSRKQLERMGTVASEVRQQHVYCADRCDEQVPRRLHVRIRRRGLRTSERVVACHADQRSRERSGFAERAHISTERVNDGSVGTQHSSPH